MSSDEDAIPSQIAVRVRGVSKLYHREADKPERSTLRDDLADMLRFGWLRRGDRRKPFLALDQLSFDVARGERIGIIGRNGAGKSTLLKVLCRISQPSSGWVAMRGRVACLLEVGTGFHPELSGLENIHLNGAILGLSRDEIIQRLPQIISFADIGPFLSSPVKHYSSGMYVRLAFAIAAHLDPDILIIDEVLAVGDVQFREKCIGTMRATTHQSRSVIFVSHDVAAVREVCSRVILIEDGKVAFDGAVEDGIARYVASE
ncbi:MAG: ABC transporter ATP-binding protein [Planctomycetes bacterium]|nr:ABC transporter ATP-binding protein [Planctomycetota bacterium]